MDIQSTDQLVFPEQCKIVLTGDESVDLQFLKTGDHVVQIKRWLPSDPLCSDHSRIIIIASTDVTTIRAVLNRLPVSKMNGCLVDISGADYRTVQRIGEIDTMGIQVNGFIIEERSLFLSLSFERSLHSLDNTATGLLDAFERTIDLYLQAPECHTSRIVLSESTDRGLLLSDIAPNARFFGATKSLVPEHVKRVIRKILQKTPDILKKKVSNSLKVKVRRVLMR